MIDETRIGRRVVGLHDIRFDGLSDLFMRARGASVIDIGMNKGHVAYDFALNGAIVVHGCDIHERSVITARDWFSELPHVQSQFEVIDLTKPGALNAKFGPQRYDITLLIGVYHKLARVMDEKGLSVLMRDIGGRTISYFGGMIPPEYLTAIDADLKACGLKRIHTSELAYPGRPAAIWKREA